MNLTETIRIYDADNKQVKGQFILLKNESVLSFVPDAEWQSLEIEIRAESRLEDRPGR